MKNKKLLSTMLAATLAATTIAMPVMAAQQGSVDVDVTDKDGVLRVEVPTTLAVQIDPYEIVEQGCQICSTDFDMVNRSEMDVKVAVSSEVTTGSGISLVSSKDGAVSSTTAGEAWLAVAAKTQASGDASGDAYQDGTAKGFAALTEANANVTTFGASGDASQTFYLGKASGDATKVYTQVVPVKSGDAGVAYAQFYELNDVTTSISGDAGLTEAAKEKDIYIARSGDASKDKASLVNIPKEFVASGDCEAGDTYYEISGDAPVASVVAGKKYVYTEMRSVGDAAGFRYVGNLSSAGGKEWSKNDVSHIAINYTISGVSRSNYDDVKEDCNYGLYAAVTGPQMSLSSTGYITITGLTAEKNYKSLDVDYDEGNIAVGNGTVWDTENYDNDEGGDLGIQLSDDWRTWLSGQTITVNLTLSDNTKISASATLD